MSPEQGTSEAAVPVVRDLLTRLSGADGGTRPPGLWRSEGCVQQRKRADCFPAREGVAGVE